MTSDVSEGLKIPTRPAPPPPKIGDNANGYLRRNSTLTPGLAKPPSEKSSRADRYVYQSVPRSRSSSDISGWKKPPPPRPPPPKLPPITATNPQQKLQSIKIKLPGFSRKKPSKNKPHVHVWRAPPKLNPIVGSLIDLQSPPKSPCNNRSSSDDSSDDSFDSDSGGPSSTENQNDYHYGSGWNGSQVESGFEDDFDRISTPSSSDPWSDAKPDPFSPQRKSVPNLQLAGCRFDISNDDPKSKKRIISPPSFCKPTVIRPNLSIQDRRQPSSLDLEDGSPPMPSVPPPPPPPEALELLAHGPPLPPRPTESFKPPDYETQKPYCTALYDYVGEVAEDLSFKENDKIQLKRRVNEEWLEGEINGRIGIFPANFVRIEVPLDGTEENGFHETTMITLFNYEAQTWDDLDLKEGELIRVIGKVDDNWLYGVCNGKRGQFPSNYTAEYSLN